MPRHRTLHRLNPANTMLNILLALYLLFVFPAVNVWRSLRPKSNKRRPLLLRYWSMSWHVLVLLSIFGIGSWQAGYTLREIGFDLPLSSAGTWGLAFAVLLLCSISLAGRIMERRKAPLARAENERKLLDSSFPWPRTGAETLAFAASMSLTSAGWEILYRGFILLVLTPSTGLPIAIVASALAYGIGHGYKNPKQLIASIVSAFVFTIAYALTHSLWWLIVIHVGLPLISVPAVLRARQRRETEIAHAV